MTLWQQRFAQWVRAACGMEVLSPKPGNVSPDFEFSNAFVSDFLKSADAIAPEMALAQTRALGDTILRSVEATRTVVNHNTNLGIILLIAPLAAVPPELSLFEGIGRVLRSTTIDDSRRTYQAIRLAQPAGLGEVDDQDLRNEPTQNLLDCMRLAAGHDMIAAQYANDFHQVLNDGLCWLREAGSVSESQRIQIAWLAIRILAEYGDSLVARKCGQEMSQCVREKARGVLHSGWPGQVGSDILYAEFDAYLREDGNQRNPGTTADLIAAILFAGQRDGWFIPDETWPRF